MSSFSDGSALAISASISFATTEATATGGKHVRLLLTSCCSLFESGASPVTRASNAQPNCHDPPCASSEQLLVEFGAAAEKVPSVEEARGEIERQLQAARTAAGEHLSSFALP